jgi:hypothetical protein
VERTTSVEGLSAISTLGSFLGFSKARNPQAAAWNLHDDFARSF